MSEIVERLRQYLAINGTEDPSYYRRVQTDRLEAAARIERLEEALRPFADESKRLDEGCRHFNHPLMPDDHQPRTHFTHGQLRVARAALGEEPSK